MAKRKGTSGGRKGGGNGMLIIPPPAAFPKEPLVDHPLEIILDPDAGELDKDSLVEYEEKKLIEYAPKAIPLYFEGVMKGAAKGNIKCLEMLGETYNYRTRAAGINIINNLQQNTVVSDDRGAYFESIIRRLESKEGE